MKIIFKKTVGIFFCCLMFATAAYSKEKEQKRKVMSGSHERRSTAGTGIGPFLDGGRDSMTLDDYDRPFTGKALSLGGSYNLELSASFVLGMMLGLHYADMEERGSSTEVSTIFVGLNPTFEVMDNFFIGVELQKSLFLLSGKFNEDIDVNKFDYLLLGVRLAYWLAPRVSVYGSYLVGNGSFTLDGPASDFTTDFKYVSFRLGVACAL